MRVNPKLREKPSSYLFPLSDLGDQGRMSCCEPEGVKVEERCERDATDNQKCAYLAVGLSAIRAGVAGRPCKGIIETPGMKSMPAPARRRQQFQECITSHKITAGKDLSSGHNTNLFPPDAAHCVLRGNCAQNDPN